MVRDQELYTEVRVLIRTLGILGTHNIEDGWKAEPHTERQARQSIDSS